MTSSKPDFRKSPFAEHYPRLTFFYGIGPEELSRTPRWMLKHYLKMLPTFVAESQFAAMTASAYPHLKEESMRRLRDEVLAVINGTKYDEDGDYVGDQLPPEGVVFESREGFALELGAAGIGLVVENESEEVTDA